MWFRKKNKPSMDNDLDAVIPVESLSAAAGEYGVDMPKLRLSIPFGESGEETSIDRHEVTASDGTANLFWRVDSLRPLFRGDRRPPPDNEMAHYPTEYVMFFYRIERNVLLFSSVTRDPTDAQFVDVYSQMRRRPDGRSTGPLHDVVWQAAALALGLRPWSEAEFTAVFGQLARSARHFKMGSASRNYMTYLRSSIGRHS